jgi:hypothetical protein
MDPPGLLRADPVVVDDAGVGHGRLDRFLGDFVEAGALEFDLAVAGLELLEQVPRDRLPFAIRIGGEIHGVGHAGRLLQVGERLLLPLQHLVRRPIVVVAVHAEALARQIAHVAVGGEDLEVLPEEFLDCPGLGRRFDDDEGLGHQVNSFLLSGNAPESRDAA